MRFLRFDALNRLTTSNENSGSSWSQTNGYDQYGNRWIDYGGGNHNLSFSTSTNRITTSGYAYDAAGNLTNDSIHSYGFDGENKTKSVDGVNDVYRYDGDGNRVRKNFALGEQLRMVYSGGQLLAEYDLSTGALKKEYVYGAKGLIATIEPSTGTRYMTSDHLGSPRVITNSSAGVVSRHDFMPFGEELGATIGGRTTGTGFSVADNVRQKFTQKERDNETGLDYFGPRYFASTQGRFTSPDEFWKDSHVGDPQSWNEYAYGRNNPLKYFDPTGEKATVTIETDEQHKRGKITVKATIALWTNKGFSQKDLQKAAQQYKANIEKAWSGRYTQDGIKYEVTTTVDIQVYGSEKEATDSGAQNVLRVTDEGGHSGIRERSVYDEVSGGPDRGEIAIDAGVRNSEAAHEFTHMLGVDDRRSGYYLSNTTGAQRAMAATAWDYAWGFGDAINSHRFESRPREYTGRQWETLNAGGQGRLGAIQSYKSTREVGAPFYWWR